MIHGFSKDTRRDRVLVIVFALLCGCLYFVPTGHEGAIEERAVRGEALVLNVDNDEMRGVGLSYYGHQDLVVEMVDTRFAGQRFDATNHFLGRKDIDKVFAEGDRAYVVLSVLDDDTVKFVNAQDFYRIDLELFLLALFAAALLIFGGWTGAKALLSFVFAGLMLWKILFPAILAGHDPVLTAFGAVSLLTLAIIFLVAGVNRRGLTAYVGAMLGIGFSCALALYYTNAFNLNGAFMPFAETLLHSGFAHLNLPRIFVAAVFLAASGAVMDLAIDVSASMQEVVCHKPDISRLEAMRSGFNVGRAVVGPMTTTLLLAYSGGYLTMLMALMAQGVPLLGIFNLSWVASEVLKTLVGSLGLVMVAPFTAIVGAFVFTCKRPANV